MDLFYKATSKLLNTGLPTRGEVKEIKCRLMEADYDFSRMSLLETYWLWVMYSDCMCAQRMEIDADTIKSFIHWIED